MSKGDHDCKFRRLVEGIERNTWNHPTDYQVLKWKMGVINTLCRKALGLEPREEKKENEQG